MVLLRRLLLASLVVSLAACRRGAPGGHHEDSGAAASATTPASASATAAASPLPPLGGVWLETIDEIGVVAVPLGATAPRPVVVALHGAGSLAEFACGDWMYPTKAYPFIVCPRSAAERPGRLASWSSVEDAASRMRIVTERVKAKFGPWIADTDPIVVGFSQGAEMAVLAADRKLVPWSALFVHEGGYRQAKDVLAKLLRSDAPVQATCCTYGCGAQIPTRLGPRAYRADYGPHGHTIGAVGDSLRHDFGRLVRDRVEWQGFFAR